MKKIIAYVLLMSLLLSAAACGNDTPSGNSGDNTTASDSSSVTTAFEKIKPNLPEANYEGYTFTFYGTDAELKFQFCEEENGDTMNDAVYKRNRAVSDRFNVEFEFVECGDNKGMDAMTSVIAGDDVYDVIMPTGRYAFQYGMQGLALDWNTDLPWIDLDAEWWDQDARESFEIMKKLNVMTGDIDYGTLAATKTMYFNRAIFDELGWDYPYQTVLDGNWTFDKMCELAVASARDLNGDTAIDLENDLLGFANTWWGMPMNILKTAGVRVCDTDANGEMILTLNSERTVEVFDKFFKMMEEDGFYIQLKDDGTPLVNAFRDSRLTFVEFTLKTALTLRDMKDEFGIIPCPKFDETMENYATGVDASCNLFVVPISVSNPERTSAIIEALAYESWKIVTPAFFDVTLSVKFARDEESVQMLDIIRASKIYDVGYFSGDVPSSMSSIGKNLTETADHNFSSYYAANEAPALAKIAEINKAYASN